MNLSCRKLGLSAATALLGATLAGCGGGSGGPGGPGGSGGSGGTTPFLSFNSIQKSSTVEFKGIGAEVGRTTDASGDSTAIGAFSPTGDITADVSYDKDGDISKVVVSTPSGKKTWDLDEPGTVGDVSVPGRLTATNAEGEWVTVADTETPGSSTKDFEYQTFGLWETIDSPTQATIGAFSVGAQTDGADIPTGGAATFEGAAGGAYADAAGKGDFATAEAKLVVNFAGKSAAFTTTNTTLDGAGARPDLDLVGNMTYADGVNSMSGTVANVGGVGGPTMSGTIDGRFYGPGAEEAGGVFGLKSTTPGSLETYGGGFGVKR